MTCSFHHSELKIFADLLDKETRELVGKLRSSRTVEPEVSSIVTAMTRNTVLSDRLRAEVARIERAMEDD